MDNNTAYSYALIEAGRHEGKADIAMEELHSAHAAGTLRYSQHAQTLDNARAHLEIALQEAERAGFESLIERLKEKQHALETYSKVIAGSQNVSGVSTADLLK